MAEIASVLSSRLPLRGARIWLSGAVPAEANAAEAESIRAFVAGFCDRVFAGGGSIVHGSHPSLRDLILERARAYQRKGGARERLTLVYSQWFAEHAERVRPRHNVLISSIQNRIGRFSARTEPSVRRCGPARAS